ncbi:hypothetical protein NQZ68_029242 [Dissostichus eleginoides]|nr:hypothetical protein NQZ68_029242 [Dissostichus eleginoides]
MAAYVWCDLPLILDLTTNVTPGFTGRSGTLQLEPGAEHVTALTLRGNSSRGRELRGKGKEQEDILIEVPRKQGVWRMLRGFRAAPSCSNGLRDSLD